MKKFQPVPLKDAGIRMMCLFIVSMVFWYVSAFIIMGEDVFWKLPFADLLYSNIGTNPEDAWNFVALSGIMLIWGVGLFWVTGVIDWLLSEVL